MRLHRLIGIIMLLDSRGTVKAGNLARILETSERTIYRDIDILCEAGIPIVSAPGPAGGFSFMEGYSMNSNVLGKGDIINLLISSMGITPEKNSETAQKLKNAVIKLENSLSKEHREEITKAKEKFFIDSDPWWGKKIENKNIDIIKKAVLNLKKLKISYKKYEGQVSERVIRPYGAVVKNSQWYVAAFCEEKNEVRIFKCSRIEKVEIIDESFNMPENFSLEEFWQESKLQFVEQASLNEEYKLYVVKIKCFEEKNKLLEGFNVVSSERVEEQWTYNIDMISFETACSLLFPLSDSLEVIEPLEIRNYIIEKAEKILKLNRLNKSLTY